MVDACEIYSVRRFTSKEGKPTVIAYVLAELNVYDVQHGFAGRKSFEVFIPEQFHKLFEKDDVIGKSLLRHFTLDAENRATVSKYEVVKI